MTMIPEADTLLDWSAGTWLNAPPGAEPDGDGLVVTAAEGSDLWRTTSYGFVHDDGHALLHPLDAGAAVEVTFAMDFAEEFDQAGVLVWAGPEHWVKSGVEFADGSPQLGAVVTHGLSDWSTAPEPALAGAIVTVRVSRAGDALTIRARRDDGPWQLVRLAPWPADLAAQAGPFCCAPTRAGLRVRFSSWRIGPADSRLHE